MSPSAAFTSLDAHNGCRALFNGTQGWAYIGPTGHIDPADFPGTVSFEYKEKSLGGANPTADGARDGRGRKGSPRRRPGEVLSRKTNDVRGVYLDAEDLEHLVREADCVARRCPSAAAGAAQAEGNNGDDGEEHRSSNGARTGQPIVLTLHAILAANSSRAAAATGNVAAAPVSATIDTAEVDGSRHQLHLHHATTFGGVTRTGTEKEEGERELDNDSGDGLSVSPPGVMSDRAHFPPLMLRGVSAEKDALFLAPPITLVKQQASPAMATAAAAASCRGESAEVEGGGCRSDVGVSCSEAVAATSVAEATQAGGDVGTGAAGVLRVGWWLRWAASGADSGDGGGGGCRRGVDDSTAVPRAVEFVGCRGSPALSATEIVGAGDGEEEGTVLCETTGNGTDGWQVVSTGVPPLMEQNDASEEGGRGGGGGGRRSVVRAEMMISRTTTSVEGAFSSLPPPSAVVAKPVAAGGGTWALVGGGVEVGKNANNDDDDAASSWCDCCASDGNEVEVEVDDMLNGQSDSGAESGSYPGCPVAVSENLGGVGNCDSGGGVGGGAFSAAVPIEVALQRAVNSTVWDNDNDDQNDENAVELPRNEHRNDSPPPPTCRPPPPPPPACQRSLLPAAATAAKNVPRSFRDMLMAPSATGATGFSESQALRARGAAAAANSATAGGAGRTRGSAGHPWASSVPTLVDDDGGGDGDGGAVYLWRRAAAGKGGKAADRALSREDEDPYYARKRVGAFAFRTKPRGKAHK